MVTREDLIARLPAYRDKWEIVTADQDVNDIIRQVVRAHKQYRPYYDRLAGFFERGNINQVADRLFDFCKQNIAYREESEKRQTTALPTGILYRGYGDCKHYAGFIGGVLDAINRNCYPIEWEYVFASYRPDVRTPYHVFVSCYDERGNELWVDPTPGADTKKPIWELRKKVK